MSFIALVGSLTLIFPHLLVERTLLALVAFAAGSLLGGAILHMIPAAVEKMGNKTELYVWFLAGFVLFLALEQFLMWHHSHTHSHYACSPLSAPHQHDMPACIGEKCAGREGEGPSTNGRTELFAAPPTRNDDTIGGEKVVTTRATSSDETTSSPLEPPLESDDEESQRRVVLAVESNIADKNNEKPGHEQQSKAPLAYLILLADMVHNFVGGLFVGASFCDSVSLGISAWVAAAAHEVPQELGDFAILIHGGWSSKSALLWNFLSALTFPLGAFLAYYLSKEQEMDVSFLIPFAAGNFVYIGATDLIPEIKHFHGGFPPPMAKLCGLIYRHVRRTVFVLLKGNVRRI
eukprot:scaffold1008_cov174-Amphora_coffeaeformis.AAC.5